LKKILIIGHRASFAGGAEDDLERILKKLHSTRLFKIDLLIPNGPRITNYKKYVKKIINYREGYLPCFSPSKIDILKYFIKALLQIFEIIFKIGFHKYEICIVNVSALIVPPLIIKVLNSKTKIVFAVREMIKPDWLRFFIFRYMNLISSGIVFVAEGIRKQFSNMTKRYDNLLTIFSAAEPLNLDTNEDVKSFVSNFINTNKLENSFLMVNIGPISPVKNQKLILESLFELKNNYNIKFIHLGAYDPNYFYVKEFFELMKKLELEKDCYILGVQNRDIVYEFIRKSNLILISSVTEGFPLVVSEAFMNKTPLITTDCISQESILNSFQNCLIVQIDPYSLSKAVEFAITNEAKMKQIIENAFLTYKNYLILEENLNKLKGFLIQLC
jgi:glycosyltransferase involved in cell wall biosynthesis